MLGSAGERPPEGAVALKEQRTSRWGWLPLDRRNGCSFHLDAISSTSLQRRDLGREPREVSAFCIFESRRYPCSCQDGAGQDILASEIRSLTSPGTLLLF